MTTSAPSCHLCRSKSIASWTLQLVVAAILFQTLFFKFTGAPESKFIFETLGLEPVGRIGSGIAESVAVILLLIPRTVVYGAILALGVITGALASHVTKLGIVVRDDHGLLFGLALIVFAGSAVILLLRRAQIPVIGRMFAGENAACVIPKT